MASLTSTAITLPSFSGLRSKTTAASATVSFPNKPSATPSFTIKASMKDAVAVAVSVAVASASFASGAAMAAEVLLGASDGSLAFVPNSLTVAPGEKIVFKNNAGFPHNVVFDEDSVPAGVDVGKISMSEEDLLNAPGEEYSVTLSEKGTYKFYCSPHQGAGMVGEITVN